MATRDEQLCGRDARHSGRRLMVWTTLGALLVAAVYLMATASTGPVDPTEVTRPAEPRRRSSSTRR